jgi:hypothetical protein
LLWPFAHWCMCAWTGSLRVLRLCVTLFGTTRPRSRPSA